MTTFVIFIEATGEITRQVSCPADQIEAQVQPGEAFIEGSGTWLTHRVHGGEVVPLDAPREAPTPSRLFDFAAGTWLDPRPLEQVKADRWDAIKAARATAEQAPIDVAGATFDADAVSLAKIMGAVQLASLAAAAGQPYSIEWTLADNTAAVLDAAGITGVGLAIGARTAAIYERARALREAIEAATTREAVEAVQW